jgi:hypothetical protein
LNKKSKIIIVIFTSLIILTSISFIIISKFELDKTSEINEIESIKKDKTQISETEKMDVNENKYYVVYIELDDGTASSFVPLKLNPGFSNDKDYHVSISIDDNGNVDKSEKIIVIENFLISNKNKETIKRIAGEKTYKEALKEIENRVAETKEKFEKEGII